MKLIRSKNKPKPGFMSYYLVRQSNGGLDLKVITEDGSDWYVMSLNNNGTANLYSGISSSRSLGLQVDGDGCIVMTPHI